MLKDLKTIVSTNNNENYNIAISPLLRDDDISRGNSASYNIL